MKYLTKKWVSQYEQVRFIHCLTEFDDKIKSHADIQQRSKDEFFKKMSKDKELFSAVIKANLAENFYQAQIKRNEKVLSSLPKEIFDKIHTATIVLGYASKEDKKVLMDYANNLLKELEKTADKANKTTEIAQDYLPEKFILDDVVGELVLEEYSNGKDYFIKIGGREVLIENYEIIEREDFKINKWEDDNPLTLWTSLYSAELHFRDSCYELHLLLIDGDIYGNKKFWYFTLKGTNLLYV